MDSSPSVKALQAVGQMSILVLAGCMAAYRGIVKRPDLKIMSGLVTGVFTPALVFSNLSAGVNWRVLSNASVLPVAAVLCCSTGMLLGYIARKTFLKNYLTTETSRLFQAACTVGNSQGLPLVLTSALVPASQWMDCVRYISLYVISIHLITWLGLYNWLQSETEVRFKEDAERNDELAPLLATKRSSVKPDNILYSSPCPVPPNSSPRTLLLETLNNSLWFGKTAVALRQSINPPLVAIMLGLFCGLTPFIHRNFAASDASLKWSHTSISRIGDAAVPLVMTILGSTMFFSVDGSGESLPMPCIVSLIIIRLMCIPLVALLFVRTVCGPFFSPDPCVMLVILVEACSPTANNITVMCSKLGINPVPLASTYFFQYLCAVPLYSVYLVYVLELTQAGVPHSSVPITS